MTLGDTDARDTVTPADSVDAPRRPAILVDLAECIHSTPNGVLLWELRPNGCLFPVVEPEPRQHLFCGERRSPGRPYCPAHQALVRVRHEPTLSPVEKRGRPRPRADDGRVQ